MDAATLAAQAAALYATLGSRATGAVDATWGAATSRVYRRLPLPRWVAGVVGRRARAAVALPNA